jgi:hypothetical protein
MALKITNSFWFFMDGGCLQTLSMTIPVAMFTGETPIAGENPLVGLVYFTNIQGSGGGMQYIQRVNTTGIGATQSTTVRVRYEKLLPALTLGTDPIQIRGATDALAYATAALAARSRGARALAADLLGTAQTKIESLILRYVKPEQTKGRRRKPYGYRARIIYL